MKRKNLRFTRVRSRTQGSLEYMFILAAVLGTSALVVFILSSSFGAVPVNLFSCKQATSQCSVKLATSVGPECQECDTACLDFSGQDIMGYDLMDRGNGCGTACSLCKVGEVRMITLPSKLPNTTESSEPGPVIGGAPGPAPLGGPSQPTPDQNTVLLLHFDEGGGHFTYDNASRGSIGIVVGADWADGKFGTGLSFDGHNDDAFVSYSQDLNITGSLTIEAWVKLKELPKDWAPIVRKGNTPQIKNWNYCLFVSSDGDLRFSIGDRSTYDLLSGKAQLGVGPWHHVAGVLNSTHLAIFVDGIEKGAVPRTINPAPNKANLLNIAKADSNYLGATIDEVMISNVARTSEEIQADCECA